MSFQLYGETDVGCVREVNEDTIACCDWHDKNFALAIVADGMGGYHGGDIASQQAMTSVKAICLEALEAMKTLNATQAEALLLEAGAEANNAIFQQRLQDKALSRMGTTLVVALAYDNKLSVMHAGDSRCYRVAAMELQPLTHDHSMVQQMLDEGVINEQDVDNVPFRNMLTKAVGIEAFIDYTLNTFTIHPGEQFLLCSDGLFNALDEALIHNIVQNNDDIEQQVHSLIKQSLLKKASDNVSAILVKN